MQRGTLCTLQVRQIRVKENIRRLALQVPRHAANNRRDQLFSDNRMRILPCCILDPESFFSRSPSTNPQSRYKSNLARIAVIHPRPRMYISLDETRRRNGAFYLVRASRSFCLARQAHPKIRRSLGADYPVPRYRTRPASLDTVDPLGKRGGTDGLKRRQSSAVRVISSRNSSSVFCGDGGGGDGGGEISDG